ncbi:wound-responsive family protein [Aphanothece sacrum FPU1]|uniref:Wound-responsive family protein n=2 Tax=Aphanothece sacrum TaxID=1122 RepID=A0A401IKZ8_APHSA|nr:wound-responsive family protein [Aphanothece sacrum FPU1]GBF83562.1 hypothetical protein AsFPU3_0605 [Aphanothece sacrum FPU3]
MQHNIFCNIMPNISIYLTNDQLKILDIISQNKSESDFIASLIEQEEKRKEKEEMLEAVQQIDLLDLGWSETEEECAIIDMELSS